MSGIPPPLDVPPPAAAAGGAPAAAPAIAPRPASGAPPPQPVAAPVPGGNPLEALRNVPQLGQILAMLQSNPQMLQVVLGELARSNPQLYQLIQQNPAQFMQLLSAPAAGANPGGQPDLGALASLLAAAGGGAAGGGGAPPPGALYVTQEEKEAIERLKSMGFDEETVIEAYFACDKNENLAANYLFDHMGEADEGP
mmetsp:Transcript_27855/g.46750  ORF Transcript_27855/g.46750 Transcript_27855/m.46750 type:complete len:197 (-) Transcript_27855:426-1016(-)